MISSGESGVRTIPEEEYKKDCLPDVITGIFCTYFGVSEPKLKKNPTPTNGSWRGRYYRKTETLCYNQEYTGLIMHELAHHIAHKLGKNGDGKHHHFEFWKILQEMHDWWTTANNS